MVVRVISKGIRVPAKTILNFISFSQFDPVSFLGAFVKMKVWHHIVGTFSETAIHAYLLTIFNGAEHAWFRLIWFTKPLKDMDRGRILYVRGIGKTISKEELTIYFQSHKQSGGGDISSIDLDGDEAVITFEDDTGKFCLHVLVCQLFRPRKSALPLLFSDSNIRCFQHFLHPFGSRTGTSFRFHFQYLCSCLRRQTIVLQTHKTYF